MNCSLKSSRLQVLLGIMLSLVAVLLVVWKPNSATVSEAGAVIPDTTQPSAGTAGPRVDSRNRVREKLPSSAESPPVHPVLPESTSVRPQNSKSSVASDATTAFYAGRATLMRDRQQLMRELVHATPEEQSQAMAKWHEEHAEELAAQQQLAIQMGAESRPPRLNMPSTANIPANATPELREFITARHAVMKDQVEMMNQLKNATPDERRRAIQQWHARNIVHLEAEHAADSQPSD